MSGSTVSKGGTGAAQAVRAEVDPIRISAAASFLTNCYNRAIITIRKTQVGDVNDRRAEFGRL